MKNYYLYIILWAGGLLIAALITLLWTENDKQKENDLFGKDTIVFSEGSLGENIVSELLLSAEKMKISGITLVSPGVRRSAADELLINQVNNKNAEQVYERILNEKLKKVSRHFNDDGFTIKPVPKANEN